MLIIQTLIYETSDQSVMPSVCVAGDVGGGCVRRGQKQAGTKHGCMCEGIQGSHESDVASLAIT